MQTSSFHHILLAFLLISLVGCSKISINHFQQVKTGMTMQEVITLLGEPTRSESVDIAGVSGTSAVWKNDQAEITIQFLNNRVVIKSFHKDTQEDKANINHDETDIMP